MDDRILWDIIDGLRDEVNVAQDGITDLNDVVKDLQAENKHLILSNERRGEMVRELQAENKRLKENMSNYPKDRYDFKCIDENAELQAEINAVKQCYEGSKMKVEELRVDNKRLVKQVSSISSNSSSTHTHTISREIAEYMDHNDINKAYIFVVDADAVDEDGFIADSHAVSTIEDSNCVSIV